MYLPLRTCKNDCKILKIILVPDFCPLKPEIGRFSIGLHLNRPFPHSDKQRQVEVRVDKNTVNV